MSRSKMCFPGLEHLITSARVSRALFPSAMMTGRIWGDCCIILVTEMERYGVEPLDDPWTSSVSKKRLYCFKPLRFCSCYRDLTWPGFIDATYISKQFYLRNKIILEGIVVEV